VNPFHIAILGGGPAGLATGFYARKDNIPFTIFEVSDHAGGNCITFTHGEFRFDSGAHRFHDKIPEVTAEMKALLGHDFQKIDAPSSIYFKGRFIDFPLSPLNLLRKLGIPTFCRAGIELLAARLSRTGKNGSFQNFAVRTYGRSIAEFFLLGYSEKLWGLPSTMLSPKIAGSRMKGLDLKAFIIEALQGQKAKTEHLDGAFYYPSLGIGTISEKLAEVCGEDSVRINARITGVIHDGKRIRSIEVNGSEEIATEFVVSTLPLDRFLNMMRPAPDDETLEFSNSLRYRSILLVAFFLNKEKVSGNASIYFPDRDIPFTRIHEPRNRSLKMSPPGKTSLIVEIPCQQNDSTWEMSDEQLVFLVKSKLVQAGLIEEREIIGFATRRMPYAYPVLERDFEEKIRTINIFLNRFENLAFSGRNGRYVYGHVHDMMDMGREIVQGYLAANRLSGHPSDKGFVQV
jgi:protoporphyrinogen oxidase